MSSNHYLTSAMQAQGLTNDYLIATEDRLAVGALCLRALACALLSSAWLQHSPLHTLCVLPMHTALLYCSHA